MRAIRILYFEVKKSPKFSELPSIVHRYLDSLGLTSGRFIYCLENLDEIADARMNLKRLEAEGHGKLAERMLLEPRYQKLFSGAYKAPIERALKDCPKLGSLKRIPSTEETPMLSRMLVSNAVEETDCTEDDIAPFFKRYERTYGMMNTSFFYYDVDFFGKSIPFIRDRSSLNQNLFLVSDDAALEHQIYGSGIRIRRDALGDVGLELSIDILHDGELYDPTPYIRAMKELLPTAKCRDRLRVFLSDEEKSEIERLKKQAEPLIAECRSYLEKRLPSKERQTLSMPEYNIAPLLKKLAKRSGYSYKYKPQGLYELKKRLPRGHFLKLDLTSGPSHGDTRLFLSFSGPGFKHRLASVMETPENQQELDAWLSYAFSVLDEFEKNYASKLNSLYNETPLWFDDTEWP